MTSDADFKNALSELPRHERLVTLYLLDKITESREKKIEFASTELESIATRLTSLSDEAKEVITSAKKTIVEMKDYVLETKTEVNRLTEKLNAVLRSYHYRMIGISAIDVRVAYSRGSDIMILHPNDFPYMPVDLYLPWDRHPTRLEEDISAVQAASRMIAHILKMPITATYIPDSFAFQIRRPEDTFALQESIAWQRVEARKDGVNYDVQKTRTFTAKPKDQEPTDSELMLHGNSLFYAIINPLVQWRVNGYMTIDQMRTEEKKRFAELKKRFPSYDPDDLGTWTPEIHEYIAQEAQKVAKTLQL